MRHETFSKSTPKPFVCGRFTSPIGVQYIVLENGKLYHVNQYLLNTLSETDETCETLELIPLEPESHEEDEL